MGEKTAAAVEEVLMAEEEHPSREAEEVVADRT